MSTDPLVSSIQTPQFFYDIHSSERFNALCRILDMHLNQRIIIFCRTKKDVDHISEKLTLINYKVSSYHGDLSPSARERGLKRFVDSHSNVLILTDIPNQIESLPNIDLVLFSIIPQDPDSYIQRIIRLESVLKIKEVATLIASNEFKKIAFIKRVTKTDITHKTFFKPNEVIDLKKQQLQTHLTSFDFDSIESDIFSFSESLLTSFDPKNLVAYLISNGFNGSFSTKSYKVFNSSNSQSSKKNNDETNLNSGMERLFIAIGKADGIDDKMLIDFLHKETNIESDRFKEIKIFDTFSSFVVSQDEAEIILEIFRRKKRGKRSIVERAKGKDIKKKS